MTSVPVRPLQPARPVTLLLVEPDPLQRQLLGKALGRAANGPALMCESGEEALAHLDGARGPHLVVTTPQLPDMDTVTFLAQLRGHPLTRGLPVTVWGRRSERSAVPRGVLLGSFARWVDRGETLGDYLAGLHALLDTGTRPPLSA